MAQDAGRIRCTTDEETIGDVNCYLFGRSGSQHLYTTEAQLHFEALPGDYALYVVANIHADMGDLTESQLADYLFEHRSTYADLPMAAYQEIRIAATERSVQLPAVEVRRQVAKIVYRIAVDASAPDIRLLSVCFENVPRCGTLFGEAAPSAAADDYCTDGRVEIPPAEASACSGVFYMLQNLQGTVPSITSQRGKNRDNAPRFATRMLIRAARGNRILDYTVFLGENNTDNFDVRRNTFHTLDIHILGDDEIDTRMHGYSVSVEDDFDRNHLGGYCVLPYSASLDVLVERSAAAPALDASMRLLTPVDGPFLIDYEECEGDMPLHLYKQQGVNYYELTYYPKVVTEAHAQLAYEVIVRDEYGYTGRFTFEHRFANEIYAVPGNGTITVSGALHAEQSATGALRAACYEQGCTFTAHAAAGYRFKGWYADAAFSRLLSSAPSYTHRPTNPHNELYARYEDDSVPILTDIYTVRFHADAPFTVDQELEAFIVPRGSSCTITYPGEVFFEGWYDSWNVTTRKLVSKDNPYTFIAAEQQTLAPVAYTAVNLSAGGTANCYIAPDLGAAYRFDARTMGNGRTTTAITPRTLEGTSAAVIWESGQTAGEVIDRAIYADGEICILTGMSYGNALVGLFDENGTCLWSWHIWVCNYQPLATAQTYTSGQRFMDRNLGALEVTPAAPSARGLYYQWGRKDPFIYPWNNSTSTQAPVVYGAGFEYGVFDPLAGGGRSTIAYAVAHPWIFMLGYDVDDAGYNSAPDWLSPSTPNLWGNASTSSTFSDIGAKSIYDPCPPGWRVPERTSFSRAALDVKNTVPYNGCNIRSGAVTAFYPTGGYWAGGSFRENGATGYVWTSAPALMGTGASYYLHHAAALEISPSGLDPLYRAARERALPVRCVQE